MVVIEAENSPSAVRTVPTSEAQNATPKRRSSSPDRKKMDAIAADVDTKDKPTESDFLAKIEVRHHTYCFP